jgi:2-keto-4-pentenoate hydratase
MSKHEQFAADLFRAYQTGEAIEPLTDQDPSLREEDAYQIQQHYTQKLLGTGGGKMIGYKVGLTSKAMQSMLGVDTPDFGPVLSNMTYDSGAKVEIDSAPGPMIAPKVEGEIVLVLKETLSGPGVTALAAARATEGAVASIEIIDSRVKDWRIKLADTVSDLGSSKAAVLSPRIVPVEFDLRLCGMTISRNGELVHTAAGAASLGNPFNALAWLANKLAEYDTVLSAGQFVMTGSLHPAFEVNKGDTIRAAFDRLGPVSVSFV